MGKKFITKGIEILPTNFEIDLVKYRFVKAQSVKKR